MTTKNEPTPESLATGRKFKEIRKASGMAGDVFGKSIELSRSAVSQIETGTRNPGAPVVALMMQRFNVSPLWWNEGVGDMFRTKEDAKRREDTAQATAAEYERIREETRAELDKDLDRFSAEDLELLGMLKKWPEKYLAAKDIIRISGEDNDFRIRSLAKEILKEEKGGKVAP